ncbi:MAG: lytic transglycosylase domain-containing protein [Acidobacteria bacterium]|nr:lytic transglycosylase domain-containing protein [Acidobacteriota bacterium]
MTLRATQSRLLRPWRPPASLLVALIAAFLFVSPVQAAETISAYVDAGGRVVFVNEGSEPRTSAPAPASTDSASSRKVLASTSRVAMAAATRSAVPSASGPVAGKTAVSSSQDLDAMIVQAAARHQIDPDLVRAIIRVESNFDPYAVSPAGARGLMQLIPSTAQRFGVANPFDPRANIDGGIRYLKHLLGMYQGNLQLTLAAYNAGENSVARFRGVPAYRETQNYIRKIGALYPMQNVPAGFRRAPKIMKFVDAAGVIHFSNTDMP